jgi:prevent-host-death family protein
VGSSPFRDRLGYWMDRVAAGEEILITRRGKPRMRLLPATEADAYAASRVAHSAHSPEMISSARSG